MLQSYRSNPSSTAVPATIAYGPRLRLATPRHATHGRCRRFRRDVHVRQFPPRAVHRARLHHGAAVHVLPALAGGHRAVGQQHPRRRCCSAYSLTVSSSGGRSIAAARRRTWSVARGIISNTGLQAHSDQHFGATPDAINWSHVGSAGAAIEQLIPTLQDADSSSVLQGWYRVRGWWGGRVRCAPSRDAPKETHTGPQLAHPNMGQHQWGLV